MFPSITPGKTPTAFLAAALFLAACRGDDATGPDLATWDRESRQQRLDMVYSEAVDPWVAELVRGLGGEGSVKASRSLVLEAMDDTPPSTLAVLALEPLSAFSDRVRTQGADDPEAVALSLVLARLPTDDTRLEESR